MRAIVPCLLFAAAALAAVPGRARASIANAPISDFNETTNLIQPGAPQVDNGIDDDCNGLADDVNGVPSQSTSDDDGDGSSIGQGDCNDHNSAVHAGLPESVGDRVDNDCDGLADEAADDTLSTDTSDQDGDGFPMSNDRVFGDAFEAA
jgi:hypothetical protein